MMILIECSASGYELIAESRSRQYLENLREVSQEFEGAAEGEFVYANFGEGDNIFPQYDPEFAFDEPNLFEEGSSYLIVPRGIIGRRGDMSTIEALRERFPLPSMLRERLAQLNQL